MVCASDRVRCREILVNLVEENIARLTVQREVHEEDVGKLAQKTVTQLGFDRSYDGELDAPVRAEVQGRARPDGRDV